MATQHELGFCNAASIIGDNNTAVVGNVDYMANALTNKTAWGGNVCAQIGGMVFRAVVTTPLTAAMSAEVRLATHSTNTLNAGNYLSTLAIPANQNAGYTVRAKLPKGTARSTYLGVVVVGAGNIEAGAISASLLPHSAEVID
jgi:hypothetical protein